MVRIALRRNPNERGQAVVLVILALSIFLFGAMGLAIDGSQLYAQRQMAQAAADAAAQAGIVSIFDGLPTIGTTAYYCTLADTTSPCSYAGKNGFTAGATACTSGASAAVGADCIKVDPNPGVTVANLDPGTPNELQVTVTRAVPMTLMKMVGLNSFNVTAMATAAIVDVVSPVPILVTHPWLSGTFSSIGNPTVQIFGGPQRSIEVNSSNSSSYSLGGSASVDLSAAGPSGTGADFGDYGGGGSASNISLGTTGHYLQPADPIDDPLSSVTPPTAPSSEAPAPVALANGVNGCPTSPPKGCMLYSPGRYTPGGNGDIQAKLQVAVFAPGIYYMMGTNFTTAANGYMQMATGITDAATGWTGSMMVYMTGPNHSGGCTPPVTPAHDIGQINVGANGSVNLTGSPTGSSYKGILFFVDRAAMSQSHSLGGGGGMSLVGTVYAAETRTMMGLTSATTCGQYQTVSLQGGSGSSTIITGEIITSELQMGGNSTITMNLSPLALVIVRQIALVNGE